MTAPEIYALAALLKEQEPQTLSEQTLPMICLLLELLDERGVDLTNAEYMP